MKREQRSIQGQALILLKGCRSSPGLTTPQMGTNGEVILVIEAEDDHGGIHESSGMGRVQHRKLGPGGAGLNLRNRTTGSQPLRQLLGCVKRQCCQVLRAMNVTGTHDKSWPASARMRETGHPGNGAVQGIGLIHRLTILLILIKRQRIHELIRIDPMQTCQTDPAAGFAELMQSLTGMDQGDQQMASTGVHRLQPVWRGSLLSDSG